MSSPLKEGEKEDRNQRCGKDHNNYEQQENEFHFQENEERKEER